MTRADRAARALFSVAFPIVMTAMIVVLDLVFRGAHYVRLSTLVAVTILSGVASMIIIETVKRLLPVRAWYQKPLVTRFMPTTADPVAMTGARLRRYAGGVGSVYNLPTEQMIAQVAARRRLEQEIVARNAAASATPAGAIAPAEPDVSDLDHEQDDAQLFNQIHVLVAGRWRHYVRTTAVWLSGAVALLLTSIHVSGIPDSRSLPIAALIFGGFVAWFARDITAVVERNRR